VTLFADGRRVAALQAGDPEWQPVLLVPGYTGSKEDFAPIVGAIAASGFRVTAIDLPGQHQSDPAPDAAGYSVQALGRVVGELVEQLAARSGSPVHLLGHSFGGLVCRSAVLDSLDAGLASLTLLDSGPAALGGARRQRIEALRPVLVDHGPEAVWAAMEQQATADPAFQPPAPGVARLLRRRFALSDPAGLLGMGDALLNEPDRIDELARYGLPTHVAAGELDDAWPIPVQEEMARRLDARWTVIIGAGHSPAVEQPARTVEALTGFWLAI
jgi:pimeloyl-ACP methyl ester carboxylesterase